MPQAPLENGLSTLTFSFSALGWGVLHFRERGGSGASVFIFE